MRLSPGLPANCVCGFGNWRLRRATVETLRGSGKVLSRPGERGKEGTRGEGSEWACALVRTNVGGAEHGVVGGRRRRDSSQAGTQAENRSRGCAAYSAAADGGPVSADLGTECGEPRSATTAVAPAPHGAGAHANYEPVASGSTERRVTL